MILAFLARISVGILTSLIFGVSHGQDNTATSNLFINYRGNSYLYEASSCWLDYVSDSDEDQKLLITGKPVGISENSSSTIGIPIGELKTLEEVDLKFIPKP